MRSIEYDTPVARVQVNLGDGAVLVQAATDSLDPTGALRWLSLYRTLPGRIGKTSEIGREEEANRIGGVAGEYCNSPADVAISFASVEALDVLAETIAEIRASMIEHLPKPTVPAIV